MTTLPSAAELQPMTPMMRQYYELKKRCGDAILLFRMGDFYEIFGADAEEVAPVLELVLTSRERGDQARIPFCGVPHHSARNYWLKLLRKGYKVALADQLEDPAEAKGLVRRDIVRTLTPGSIDDPEGLERDAPNYVLAVYEEPTQKQWALAVADLSTGELRLGAVQTLDDIRQAVERFRPKEVVARRFFHAELASLLAPYTDGRRLLLEALPESPLRDKAEQKSLLTEVFGKPTLASQPSGEVAGGEALVAALLCYFRSLQASIGRFLAIRPLIEPHTMVLDETAVRDLELFETSRRRESDGSLFREIDRTLSPMGARLLRYFLANPLIDPAQIRGRHAAVRGLLAIGEARLSEARQQLKHLPDLERLATRVACGLASPTELQKTQLALEKARWILDNLTGEKGEKLPEDLYKAVATGLKFFKSPLKILHTALNEAPKGLGTGVDVFKPGYDEELDHLNALARSGESEVEKYQDQLRAATGISSLKIKHHKSYGLLIEVTKTHLAKIPASFIRRQTMVNCDRFTTVELQELGETLLSANEKAVLREAELYQGLLTELAKFRMDLRSVAQALATFDLLQSFAWQALRHGYAEPRIADDDRLELRGSRHPVVERFVGRHAFTPNDIVLSPQRKHLLITGPNMAGKSTVMRQTALAAILCQIGSYVPAQSARLPVFDRVFTRVGAADDLSRGQSTFMVEMAEAANILRHSSQKSLVILDEVGRGTSTRDGLALAQAIMTELAQRVRCYSLFATHYHELVPLAASLPSIRPVQTEVLEQQGRIIFTHRLKDGASDSSYGLEVARLAGIPESVLKKAAQFVAASSSATSAPPVHPPGPAPTQQVQDLSPRKVKGASVQNEQVPLERFGLATAPLEDTNHDNRGLVLERLNRLNVNRLTPLQALNVLADLQTMVQAGSGAPELFPTEESV